MRLNLQSLTDSAPWIGAGVRLPGFDVAAMARRTREAPVWVHFGSGNIFRAYIADIQHRLLEQGLADRGITAVVSAQSGTFGPLYRDTDHLTLLAELPPKGGTRLKVVAGIGDAVLSDDHQALGRAFEAPSLQLASFTITEKGYRLKDADGAPLPDIERDMRAGPHQAQTTIGIASAALLRRMLCGGVPIAMLSLDNMNGNGDQLKAALLGMARAWAERGLCDARLPDYIEREVACPISMIDKIVPRPDESVRAELARRGIEGMEGIVTRRGTHISPFVNAEVPGYLCVEDSFPNGRPPLERAGVLMGSRERVEQADRLKVSACLNPVHTALAVYGCLLGYDRVCLEMNDPLLARLARTVGEEGLRVADDPGIINPRAFLEEVLTERIPNPKLPDTPQRIACDTSQKVPQRYATTIRRTLERPGLSVDDLIGIPLALAGWLRYLLALDDGLNPFELSPDPRLDELTAALSGVRIGDAHSAGQAIAPLLCDARLFGLDLEEAHLAPRITELFIQMTQGAGAVRATLNRNL